MTPGVIAAHQAADREFRNRERCGNQVVYLDTFYVRAFLAGARWHQDEQREVLIGLHKRIVAAKQRERELELRVHHYEQEHNLPDDCCLTEFTRVETLINSPTPATGSAASPDTAESPPRGKS